MKGKTYFIRKGLAILGAILFIELLVFALLVYGTEESAIANPENSPLVNVQISYTEPVVELHRNNSELLFQGVLNFSEEDIVLTEAEVWRSSLHDLLIGMKYQFTDPSSERDAESRIVVVLRDTNGSPIFIGDTFLIAPSSEGQTGSSSNSLWFLLSFNRRALGEYAETLSHTTIDVGITRSKMIVVAGPGPLAEEERADLTPLLSLTTIEIPTQ